MYTGNMAHLHRKMKKGRPYYYVREIQRVDGVPKVVSQIYLGSVEAIASRFREAAASQRPLRLQAREFGALFLAHLMETRLDTIGLIDSIVPRSPRETGPSVGEYFFYAWANRLIDPKSKRALPDWYRATAVDQIRPVDVEALCSQRFWEKWDRVSADQVEAIGKAFFERLWNLESTAPECLLFDTTNYYPYMASPTSSDLCARGHNKDSKHHLRQVGLALLVDRATELPLFDKGMNSEEAIHSIDDHGRVHFITSYSTSFAEDLAGTDLRHFAPLAGGEGDDAVLAYRTKTELWGRERTVIVTHNPKTARKKRYTLEQKL